MGEWADGPAPRHLETPHPLQALEDGIVRSASVMANGKSAAAAMEKARKKCLIHK